ncbi:hypothetical protein FJT64_003454 [Amphibalanus amphitrite]|uniref:Uncharacterized protein n=1 Tax=Amphibalanus amphitrite TaxID=1232801 RepID=A0A6A4W7E3_AMPAM|nr:uncharacterized protein LOC122384811 [Amphibalanus amphitrite]KAF0299590.1 hypothetical protein FJT64_003454 [Amphibalanus amphitrite]
MKCHVIAALCLAAVIASVTADSAQHVQGAQQAEPQFQPQQQFQRPQQPAPFRPLPYNQQLRRQSPMSRMRDSIYSFFSNLMSAGRQFRQQASARIFSMFNRRSINRRLQRQEYAPAPVQGPVPSQQPLQ